MIDLEKEIEAFEAWATDKFPIAGLGQFEKHNNGTYLQRSIRNMYEAWQAAKAQAVPEKDAIIKKLSDQLYDQEMKTSAASVLCETACELLDDYAHQDAMVILNDLEQAMKEPTSD